MVRQQLNAKGLKEVPFGEAEVIVFFSYGIDGGKEAVSTYPIYGKQVSLQVAPMGLYRIMEAMVHTLAQPPISYYQTHKISQNRLPLELISEIT